MSAETWVYFRNYLPYLFICLHLSRFFFIFDTVIGRYFGTAAPPGMQFVATKPLSRIERLCETMFRIFFTDIFGISFASKIYRDVLIVAASIFAKRRRFAKRYLLSGYGNIEVNRIRVFCKEFASRRITVIAWFISLYSWYINNALKLLQWKEQL